MIGPVDPVQSKPREVDAPAPLPPPPAPPESSTDRYVRLAKGGGLLALGAVLVPVPGPVSLPLVYAGLRYLAPDIPLAKSALDQVDAGVAHLTSMLPDSVTKWLPGKSGGHKP